ncbi:hypothetical protein [Sediminibacterium sp.]|uniref:hypothetical protein n=1 Tax=Sediminibacterium sp. TaxID=1917865 RepID=UPI002731D4D3|nr:hypothetical protein [Sediminibacterium sp.]MDP2421357.1 hypothetical protein [Sediminibacterium sp.]
MRTGLMMIWLLSMGITSAAQLYQTQSGIVQVNGRYKGANLTAVSNHLFMHLNYDRAEMHLRLMVPTLVTENDSLNELLQKLAGQELAFDGKMNIAFVQTKNHPKQKFTTQGMLFLNGTGRSFSFNVVLEHFPRGNASCILSGEFVIDLQQFKIENLRPGEEKVLVKFNQLVLKKSGE